MKAILMATTLVAGLTLLGTMAGAQPAVAAPGAPVATTPGAPPAAPPATLGVPAPGAGPRDGNRANRAGGAANMNQQRARQLMQAMQGTAAAPALAVTEKHVFVVFGGTLYQFSVDGLQLIASAPLNLGTGRPGGARNPGQGAGGPVTPAPAPGLPAPQ
jgi:hypothetical protein